jgi:hypothetical protein
LSRPEGERVAGFERVLAEIGAEGLGDAASDNDFKRCRAVGKLAHAGGVRPIALGELDFMNDGRHVDVGKAA